MSPQFEILIRNCQLRGRPQSQYDIAISDGHINDVAESLRGTAHTEIDAHGNLVTESFVNAHLHLCKVYTLEMMDEEAMKDYHGTGMGKAMTAIELASMVKEKYAESWIIKNVRKAMALSAKYGCTHTRAFADVDTKAKLEGVKALIRAREEFRGVVDIQVVAFAQDGIVREPGAADLVRQAMDLGADVVGGIPWIEFTDALLRAAVSAGGALAAEALLSSLSPWVGLAGGLAVLGLMAFASRAITDRERDAFLRIVRTRNL